MYMVTHALGISRKSASVNAGARKLVISRKYLKSRGSSGCCCTMREGVNSQFLVMATSSEIQCFVLLESWMKLLNWCRVSDAYCEPGDTSKCLVSTSAARGAIFPARERCGYDTLGLIAEYWIGFRQLMDDRLLSFLVSIMCPIYCVIVYSPSFRSRRQA